MVSRVEQDHQRFRQIVKGRIRKDLRKFLQRRELIGKEGRGLVSIPVYDLDTPTFRYGDNSGGVGMGEGEGHAEYAKIVLQFIGVALVMALKHAEVRVDAITVVAGLVASKTRCMTVGICMAAE